MEQENPPSHAPKKCFAPFVANILDIQENKNTGICFEAATYNQKYNLIITSPAGNVVQFFDATTLLPSEEFKTQELDDKVVTMVFCPETETFIFGCYEREIYSFCLSSKTLRKLERPIKKPLFRIAFLSSSHYAFSQVRSDQIHIQNFENENLHEFPLEKSNKIGFYDLRSLPKRNLLFSSHSDGSIRMYRTNCLPRLPLLYSIPIDHGRFRFFRHMTTIKGKDYIFTVRNICIIEVWHLTKGKVRKLKTIRFPEPDEAYSLVYLEDYKMIVTTNQGPEIRFTSLFSGKSELKFKTGMNKNLSSFLMKDKNAIGVLACNEKTIQIAQISLGK